MSITFPNKNCQTELNCIVLQSRPESYSGSFLESFRIRIGIPTYRLHGYGSDAHFEYEVKVKSIFCFDKNLYYNIKYMYLHFYIPPNDSLILESMHIVLDLQIAIGEDVWGIYRRYSRFRQLHQDMKKKFPEVRGFAGISLTSMKYISSEKWELFYLLSSENLKKYCFGRSKFNIC